jgi:hypothetical protein
MRTRETRNKKWDERDLIRRLCHALDIASLTVEHLASAGFRNAQQPEASIRPEKPIAETAMLLNCATLAARHSEVSMRIDRVARQLAPHARSPHIRLGLALNPVLAFDYSLAHVILTRLGYPDASFDELLRQCRAAQAHAGRERVPHRMLEQNWIDSLWSGSAHEQIRRRDRTAQLSILGTSMDLFGATDEDLYAFTHAVMYVTGFQLEPAMMPRSRAVILAEAEAMLARCLDGQDYDLAGEILLAWPLTGKTWSPAATFAFGVLAAVEDKAGFLPTPATRVSELKAREGHDRTQYLLATAYHTVYVMGLLCAAMLQPGCAPAARISSRRVVRGGAEQLLPYIRDNGAQPHWREVFGTLSQHEADALTGLLFNIALQRSAGQRDFAGVIRILRLGRDLGLASTPAASQAAEMLERVAICAAGVGSQKSAA